MALTADNGLVTADTAQGSSDGYFGEIGGGEVYVHPYRGGTSRGGRIPPYWWQAQYTELREIPLPTEPKPNEVAQDVLARLQAIWRDLDEREVKFQRMLKECDRLEKLIATWLEFHAFTRLLTETKQRIQAAEDARRARAEEAELEELLVVL